MRQKGFTLLELMIVACVLGILGAIAVSGLKSYNERRGMKQSEVTSIELPQELTSQPIATPPRPEPNVQCIDGYLFAVGVNGTEQVKDTLGAGVACVNR